MNVNVLSSPIVRTTLWVLLAVVICVPVYREGILLGVWPPLTRPYSVPREATHVAGFKFAPTWYDCRFDPVKDVNPCRIWSGDGKLMFAGDFRLEDVGHAAPPELLRPSTYQRTSEGILIDLYGPNKTTWGPRLVSVTPRPN